MALWALTACAGVMPSAEKTSATPRPKGLKALNQGMCWPRMRNPVNR